MIKKFNPLQQNINKTRFRGHPPPVVEKQKIKPLVLPLKAPLNPGPTKTSIVTPNKAPVKKTLKNSSRVTNTPRGEEFRDFEENLPPNCYFKIENRNELPNDTVKLIKLKLLKTKTEKNIRSEISRLKAKNSQRFNKSQVPRIKQNLARLNQTILEKNVELKNVRIEHSNLNNTDFNNGKFY